MSKTEGSPEVAAAETNPTRDARLEAMDAAYRLLGAHFDTVQVVCTVHVPADDGIGGVTTIATGGTGNRFARIASMEKCLSDMEQDQPDAI